MDLSKLSDEQLLALRQQPKSDLSGLSNEQLLAMRKTTPGSVIKQAAKEYGPSFLTGLGEDAAIGAAGSFFPALYAQQILGGNYYTGALPGAIQRGAEALTGSWPQPKDWNQQMAKYAGNALPPALAAIYLAPRATGSGILGAWLYDKGKRLLGRNMPDLGF